jgi:putative membrane protein
MWSGYGEHMAWMALWWTGGVAVLVPLVWAIARAAGSPGTGPAEESPETILKRRYARGDIDREEFDRRLTDFRK